MKIIKISIKNFKSLTDVEVELNGKSIIVLGPNNAGKSSFIDAAFDILQNGSMPTRPIKVGEDHAEIAVEVGEPGNIKYIVKKSFTPKKQEGYLSITTPDGASYSSPVEHLKKLFGTISFDMDGLLASKNEAEMAKKLKLFLGIDTTISDAKADEAYKERTIVNREIKAIEPLVKEKVSIEDLEKRKVELQEEVKQREPKKVEMRELEQRIGKGEIFISTTETSIRIYNNEVSNINVAIDKAKKEIEELQNVIKAHEANEIDIKARLLIEKNNLAEAKPLLEQVKEKKKTIVTELENTASSEVFLANVEKEIEEAEKNNKLFEELETKKKKSQELTDTYTAELKKSADIYKASSTEDVQFTEDGGILYKGLPLDRKQINTAGLAELALSLVLKSKSALQSVRFDASFMDNKTFAECAQKIEDAGFQAFVEMVDKDGEELEIQVKESLIN